MQTLELQTPLVIASGDSDVIMAEEPGVLEENVAEISLSLVEVSHSTAQEGAKHFDSDSDSDYDLGLDEDMEFSKLLDRSM